MPSKIKVGIIGGSGLDDPEIFENQHEVRVTTPFGEPSDALLEGTISGVPCVLLSRHGRKHSIMPGNVNFRANIWALKEAGCTHVLASNACGGLQEYTQPGDLVVLDDFFDRTQNRKQTFYDGEPDHPVGVVHLPASTVYCERTRQVLIRAAQKFMPNTYIPGEARPEHDVPRLHLKGSCVTIEGPRFSSRCESKLFHSLGFDVINMTNVPEVILAREAGLSYATLAIVTDYCAWHDSHDAVNVEVVMANFKKSAETVKNTLIEAVKILKTEEWDEVIAANRDVAERSRQDVY
ncbi:methylthioadenosine phosphorylase [Echinococcus multilocularis]|uniref:Purine nucleoside phosphorylase n=1 Tax=Echinococcus multilocularis TaxID=6211 RepID=A0A068Y2N0_ECHMU|nr:methylthioadenosine phosphorylase [Echinococcus multilocularis]